MWLTLLENHSQLLRGHDFANERLLVCQFDATKKKLKQIITVNSSTNAPITKNNSCTLCVPMFLKGHVFAGHESRYKN